MQTPRRGDSGSRLRTALLAVLVVVATLVPVGVSPSPALARGEQVVEEGEELEFDDPYVPIPVDQLVELPGTCPAAAPIEPGNSIDCFFNVLPGVDPAVERFAEVLFDGSFAPCHVEAGIGGWDRLVCPNLLKNRFEQGTVNFGLRIEGEVVEGAATATSVWVTNPSVAVFVAGPSESIVFEGRPLRWSGIAYEPVDGLFLNVRERNGTEIIKTIEVEVGEPFESVDGSIEPALPIGRYRMWPCVGASAATCEEQPGGEEFQVIDGEPLELIPDHNRRSADRINVLFVSSGLGRSFPGDPSKQLPDLARTMLTIGGPAAVDVNGEFVGDDEKASNLLWGPMAIEPLASHLDRFNFWYLSSELADEEGVLFGGLDPGGENDGFDLPNLHITALYNDGADFASDARWTSFDTFEPAPVPARGQIHFGDARVWVPRFAPFNGVTTLAHEWGHGIFGLRDEYYGFDDRGITAGYPNCAPDIETAEQWWGDALGEVDPFVDEVIAMQDERLESPVFASYTGTELVERVTIQITEGGCYSDAGSTEVYRPSVDSLMNSEVPVFGAINRRRVQEVLSRFSGRGPMTTLDDVTITCEGLAGFVNCRGELRTYLNKPLSIVAINSIPCEFGSARPLPDGTRAPVPITCSTTGEPSAPVELTYKSEALTLEVLDVNVPPPSPVPQRILAERAERLEERALEAEGVQDNDTDDEPAGTGRTVIIGVLLCLAAISLGFVERRRRSNETDD